MMSIKAGNGKLGSISAVDGDVAEMRLGKKSIAIRSWWAITLIQSPGYHKSRTTGTMTGKELYESND
jgi:hypothetical protein